MSSPILFPRRSPVVPLLDENGKILPEFLPDNLANPDWENVENIPDNLKKLAQVTAFRGNAETGLAEVKNATTGKWHPVFADGDDGAAQLATDPTGNT